MITRITGILLEINTDLNTVALEIGPIVHELMVPGYAIGALCMNQGEDVTFYTLEYYESSGSQGGNLVPRIIGFPEANDKAFFQTFITVKGIGIKKALRALSKPIGDIANAIESGDAKYLVGLPEIGKRSGELIIAELKGKMTKFALVAASRPNGSATQIETTISAKTEGEREAIEVLIQLGEKRPDAETLVSRVVRNFEDEQTADALVQAVYRLKAGAK